MQQAMALAEGGRGRVSPNPLVGAVVLAPDGSVAGEGFHLVCGGPHAEVLALAAAGPMARGGTLVVTLEPCRHHGKTPPCTDAIIAAGIGRVVYAAADPNPVAAGGALALARAGVAVERLAAMEGPVRRQNAPFFKAHWHGLPFVTAKWAMTLDGQVAGPGNTRLQVTGPTTVGHAMRLRAEVDAVVVGIGTVLADDPLLTVRGVPSVRPPRRVVMDSMARTPLHSRLVRTVSEAPVWVVVGNEAPEAAVAALAASGCRVLRIQGGPRPDLATVFRALLADGAQHLLCEGGPAVHRALFAAGLVDRVVAYVAPWGGDGWRLSNVDDVVITGDVEARP